MTTAECSMETLERECRDVLTVIHMSNQHAAESVLLAFVADKIESERGRCAKLAEDEKVDADATGTEGDIAYNTACDHIAAAIRAR